MTTTFSNLRNVATVKNVANGITLNGEMQHNENNLITNFNGRVEVDSVNGNFNYSETSDGNISYGINVPLSIRRAVEDVMFATVTDIHKQYDIVKK